MLELDVELVGMPSLLSMLKEGDKVATQSLRAWIKAGAEYTERQLKENAPLGWTGNFKASMTTSIATVGTEAMATIFSIDDPGKVGALETGRTSSNMPPVDALLPWVEMKLGGDRQTAFLVARAIAQGRSQGTANTGQRTFETTFGEIVGPVLRMADDMIKVF